MGLIICTKCGAQVSDMADFCSVCGKPVDFILNPQKEKAFLAEVARKNEEKKKLEEERLRAEEKRKASEKEMLTLEQAKKKRTIKIAVIVALLVCLGAFGIWYFLHRDKTVPVQSDTSIIIEEDIPSTFFVGKTYKGGGNSGGNGINMTITFTSDNKCVCLSDWYRTYYPDMKKIEGTYDIKDGKVIVRCWDWDREYKFAFNVNNGGMELSFNQSDPEVGASMGNDYMSLVVVEGREKNTSDISSTDLYVDLGLPSGTLWKSSAENGFYDYDSAIKQFGNKIPSYEQFVELKDMCSWEWNGSGYTVSGRNGNSIYLKAAGWRDSKGKITLVGTDGGFWTSKTSGYDDAWYLNFTTSKVRMLSYHRNSGLSVLLVK